MPTKIKATTQNHLNIEDIKEDLVILKDGSSCIILKTSAVNFSLLSEGEQDSTIYAYAGLLNSLNFPVQILITSERKNINSYLNLLNIQKQKITNPLLKTQLEKYYVFIQKTVQENEVLDKKFYLSIPFSNLELGVSSTLSSALKKQKNLPLDKSKIIEKAKTSLLPKKDHLISQLTRLGLKTKQLTTPELIKLFFGYYNPGSGNVDFTNISKVETPIIKASISKDVSIENKNKTQHEIKS
ncbi:MAG: hypothetical protein U9Q63_00615 [Patescibacteria group bacterium]|nr:hypothetical protein [Patescibacteria group bacterium]